MPEIMLVKAKEIKPMMPAILNSALNKTMNNKPINVLTMEVVATLKAPKR